MNVLVIGGTGFISGRVVDLLLERGHDVTVFTRGLSERSFARSVDHVQGDRRSADSMREAVRSRTFDVVVDMIAYEADDSAAAVDAFAGRAARFVHCSTVSVYMVSEHPTCPITEDQDHLPEMDPFPRNPFGMEYGLKKRACEDVLWEAHADGAFALTALRPTYVCGPEDKTLRDYFWIQRILDGKPLLVPGSGDHAFQQVYVDDAARAFVEAVEREETAGNAYNVASEDIYSLNEYIRKIARLLERDVELVHVPQDVFDRLPVSVHPRGDVFPFNTRRTAVFSLDRLRRDLEYVSTPFDQWMRRTMVWYLDHYDGVSLGYDRRDEEVALARNVQDAENRSAAALLS